MANILDGLGEEIWDENGYFITDGEGTTNQTMMRLLSPNAITAVNLISSNIAEDEYPSFSLLTTYALGEAVISANRIYESLQDDNLGNLPAENETLWLDIGATNRWKMFDGQVGTQSVESEEITVSLDPGTINSIALLELYASSVTVEITDGVDTLYTKTTDLNNVTITDWYEYFTASTARKTDLVLTDLGGYGPALLNVTISAPYAEAKCGLCIPGYSIELGQTQWGARVGIIDYSRKETDEFGNPSLTRRKFSKRLTADLFVDNTLVDTLTGVLANFRATPVVWIGSETYTSTIVYGFYRDFETVLESYAGSRCALEIEGLI